MNVYTVKQDTDRLGELFERIEGGLYPDIFQASFRGAHLFGILVARIAEFDLKPCLVQPDIVA